MNSPARQEDDRTRHVTDGRQRRTRVLAYRAVPYIDGT